VSNTPLRRHKTWVYEGGISTPLVMHWPAGIAAKGELRRNPGHVIDIVPTILDLVGVDSVAERAQERGDVTVAPPRPGKSLVPVLARDDTVPHEYLWWLHDRNRALRAGDWKIVADMGAPWELYDLSSDRAESRDLAASNPDKVNQLETVWDGLAAKFRRQAQITE
jgi:arylsulfatase